MSSVIRDIERLNHRQLETAKRRHERELKTVADAHGAVKNDLKKAQESEIVDINNEHHKHIDQQEERKEKILADMNSNLNKTKEVTDKQLRELTDRTDKTKTDIHEKYTHDRERIVGENELFLEDINDRQNQAARKVNYDGKLRVEELKDHKNDEYLAMDAMLDKKLSDQTTQFKEKFDQDGREQFKIKTDQDTQFKNERMSTNLRQQLEMKKMTEGHVGDVEKKDDHYRKGLKDQDLFFENKYGNQVKTHSDQFKVLETKNQKVLDDLKTNLSKEMVKAANRNDDPFYKFETLNPKLKQFEDRVEVTVEIPEHSKQDIQLTTNGKEAVLLFNRRYNDASKSPEGVINKINKIETFTTRIKTDMHLDAKSLKSSYENGTMTYTVKKA